MMGEERAWQALEQSALQAAAVCFASTDEYLLETAANRLSAFLQQQWDDTELTSIAGEEFTLEEAVLAAGTISFFSTRRIIRINRLQLSALSDKELTEFCALLQDTENAVFLLTLLYKSPKDRKSKKMAQLEAAVRQSGCWMDLAAPQGSGLKAMARQLAAEQGAQMTDAAAAELVERTGSDLHLLANEVAKLAAGAGYETITPQTVAALGARTVEADVFKMVDAVTGGRPAQAFALLDRLLYLRSEPITIAGALASSFVDMARVQAGARRHVGYAAVWKDLRYTGSDYRLKRAAQTAARYTPQQLHAALEILVGLDTALKSSPVDRTVLLQTALSELCGLQRGRE